MRRVAVVVLGEIGQSPRMLRHALALARQGVRVDLHAYAGAQTPAWLRDHPLIDLHPLPAPSRARHQLPPAAFVAYAAGRISRLGLRLVANLAAPPPPTHILVQTPPAIPTLAAARLAARLTGAQLVVDWHNYGHSLLALRLGRTHPATRALQRYERFATRADAHLCVSRAMQQDLAERGIDAQVLYDLPVEHASSEPSAPWSALCEHLPPEIVARLAGPDRPAVLVSASSWTADEDFGLLLDALCSLDPLLAADDLPELVVLLTGLGPEREAFEQRVARSNFTHCSVHCLWVDDALYPALLRSCDLGLSVHRSSSGVDLPMKIVDMLGAGLPVCAFDYGSCLAERVTPETGLLFRTGDELAEQLARALRGHPRAGVLVDLRARMAALPTWEQTWDEVAAPLLGCPP